MQPYYAPHVLKKKELEKQIPSSVIKIEHGEYIPTSPTSLLTVLMVNHIISTEKVDTDDNIPSVEDSDIFEGIQNLDLKDSPSKNLKSKMEKLHAIGHNMENAINASDKMQAFERLATIIHPDMSPFGQNNIAVIVKNFTTFDRSTSSPNYDSVNNIHLEDLLWLCADLVDHETSNRKKEIIEQLVVHFNYSKTIEQHSCGLIDILYCYPRPIVIPKDQESCGECVKNNKIEENLPGQSQSDAVRSDSLRPFPKEDDSVIVTKTEDFAEKVQSLKEEEKSPPESPITDNLDSPQGWSFFGRPAPVANSKKQKKQK